jgi:hypothetical protein
MFKQISILVISIFLSFIVTKQILKKKFNKFLFIPGIVKYPVKSAKLKKAKNIHFNKVNLNNIVFYTLEKVNHNNYIYDIENDYYYLIEPGYYYYIKDSTQFSFGVNDLNIFYQHLLKNNSNKIK